MMFKNVMLFLFFTFSVFSQSGKEPVYKNDSASYYIQKSVFFEKNGDFQKANYNANKAIFLGQKTKNKTAIIDGYFTLSVIHIDLKKYDNAIENLLRTVSILNTIPQSSKLALAYYNLGLCYIKKNDFSTAEDYFNKANAVYESIDLPGVINRVNFEKALLYLDEKEVAIAEKIFLEIAHLPDTIDSFKLQSEAFYQLGKIKETQKTNELALSYLNKAYLLSCKNKNVAQQIKISEKLSQVYEATKESEKSLHFLKIHIKLEDSIANITTKDKVKKTAFQQYKTDEIMNSLVKLEKEKIKQLKSAKFSKLINILSIALITILSLLSLSLYKNNIIRNKSNELLRDKNSELEIAKERIEKASKIRAEFLSTVSHELRTPLNAINGISHILLDDNPKPSQVEYLKSLHFSGNYLLTYINEILEINRIESDNIEIEKINFNLKELLYSIQNALKELAIQNNNDFRLDIDSAIPEKLLGDPTKLSQVFINLINNALKFTDTGTITVNAKLVAKDETSCKIKFEIQDTGIGIAMDKKESIFESFSQGSVEINRKYGGTGLGLAIVKRLISLMGGKIIVKSELGVGSTFTFKLNFSIPKDILEPAFTMAIANDQTFVNKKILLVEDNKINQMVTQKFLEKKKMICDISETGEDAIRKMESNTYDLVLMDVHLPGINGTIATELIRKFNTSTPIIALTAISLNENREMLLSYGMNDVITKPFSPDDFYKTVEANLLLNANIV